ncbi:alpha/beta hydrolase family protein [Solidesulfovibrio sp.]
MHCCALALVMLLTALSLPVRAAPLALPSSVRYEHIGDYPVERLNTILTAELAAFSSFTISYPPAKNAVSLYKVYYETVIPERGNKPTTASGLIAVPQVAPTVLPVVSYQHGTVFTRTAVPSHPEESMETRLMIARFAGQGYIVIGADYIGKGESPEPDSYMVRDATAQACLDMLFASRVVCAGLGLTQQGLFLSGWSQGAWATMQFRHKLEDLGIPVTAAATASTPSDLYVLLTRWINNPTALDASWLPGTPLLFLFAYEHYYDLPGLSQAAIREEYWPTARDLYANTINWEQAAKKLPATVRELLRPEFAAESSMGTRRFYRRLQDNAAYRWRYRTPSRYYYGKIDEVMPPYVATLPVDYAKAVGAAPAEAVFAGDSADHRGTFLFGVLDQKEWFDSLNAR